MVQHHITPDKMKHNFPPYTLEVGSPERLEREKEWDIVTGELLAKGADWEKPTESSEPTPGIRLKQLGITQTQYEKLHETYVAGPERKEFLKDTKEGRQIARYKQIVNELRISIWNRLLKPMDHAKIVLPTDRLSLEEGYGKYFRENGFSESDEAPIDFKRLDDGDEEYAIWAREVLEASQRALDELVPRLIKRHDLRNGKKVTVLRSAKRGQVGPTREQWVVEKPTASGKVRVHDEDRTVRKDLEIEVLEALNPLA